MLLKIKPFTGKYTKIVREKAQKVREFYFNKTVGTLKINCVTFCEKTDELVLRLLIEGVIG